MSTTVLIITHNSGGHIRRCLETVGAARATRILVVDNASTDGTIDEIRASGVAVDLIVNPWNRGFAGAANQGFQASSTPLVLLLNPDAEWQAGLADLERACLENGIACGRLTNPDGTSQSGFNVRRLPSATALSFESLGVNRVWPSNAVNRQYRALDLDPAKPQPVEQPAGAMLMVRRDVWESLNGFDEQFHPVWFEDVDFCRRAITAGWRIQYTPVACALHIGGHSVNRLEDSARIQAWYGSLLRYASKHFSGTAFRAICASVAFGCGLRITAALVRRASGPMWSRRLAPLICVLGFTGRSFLTGRAAFPVPALEALEGQAEPRGVLVP